MGFRRSDYRTQDKIQQIYIHRMKRASYDRAVQCLKDRTEGFDDYYPCIKEECELELVYKWSGLFVFMYNAEHTSNLDC